VKVWIISTSGRRGKLRTIVEGSEHTLQNAEAVTIRTDMLASVQRALAVSDITIVLDAVSLAVDDIQLSIDTIRRTNPRAPIILILTKDGKDKNEESAIKSFGLAGPYSVIFDESEQLESVLVEAIESPQSLRVDTSHKKKWFQFFKKKDVSTKASAQRSNQSKDKAVTENTPPVKAVLARRVGYALADNVKTIFFSIILTIAVSVIYFAITEKGLTFVEIGQYVLR